jgi:hypothetical protein
MQIFLDFVGQMQVARRREEEERERSRQRKKQRAIVGGAVGLGAVGGALLAPAAVASASGAIAGLPAGTALTAAGTAATPALLGSVLTGAGVGAQVGGAFARDDPAAAMQGLAQGAATLANLPGLQQQGYSPLEVAMGGAQGLPNLLADVRRRRRQQENLTLRDAQISRRQQDQSIRQEVVARRQRDQVFKGLTPSGQAAVTNAEHLMAQARISYIGGELGAPGSPGALDAYDQTIAPHLVTIEETMKDSKVPEPLSTKDQYESGQGPYKDEAKQAWIIPNGRGGWQVKTDKPDFTPEKRHEAFKTEVEDEYTEMFEDRVNLLSQQLLRSKKFKTPKEAEMEAGRRLNANLVAVNEMRRVARQKARATIDETMPPSRIRSLQPTEGEKAQQQEAVKQQQEVTEQQQQAQRQQAEEEQQGQQVTQVQMVFDNSGQVLASVSHEWGTAPSEWSKGKVEAARPAAEAFIQAATALLPTMSPEESLEIRPLAELATAIADQPRTLAVPTLLPPEAR